MSAVLTRQQRRGLKRLIDLQLDYGMTRWATPHIGQSGARALRSLEGTGLVEIDRRQSNLYFYKITDAGRAAVKSNGGAV